MAFEFVEKEHFNKVISRLEELAKSEDPIYIKEGVNADLYEEDRLLLEEKARKCNILERLRSDYLRFRKWFLKLFNNEPYNPMTINGQTVNCGVPLYYILTNNEISLFRNFGNKIFWEEYIKITIPWRDRAIF
nr:hypothetical transcript [Hymenolepis microstoma]